MARILSQISSPQNPWIKVVCRLHRRSERYDQNRFLLEGPNLLDEAIAANWPIEAVCYNPTWAESHPEWLRQVVKLTENTDAVLQPVSEEVLRKMATTDSPCSIVTIAKITNDLGSQVEMQKQELHDTIVAFESIQDPGNLGSMVRIAAAVGQTSIVISPDSVDPTSPKVLRSSTGQWFRNPPISFNLFELVEKQRSQGYKILAAAANGVCMWDLDLAGPTLLLLGNEGAGLSHRIRSSVTETVSIPMAKGIDSLNVSVAGGLILYEKRRQLKRREMGFS